MKLRMKIKRLKGVDLPKYAREFDAGFDLVVPEVTIIWPGETKVVPTGLAFKIPPGYELQVRPRSGMTRDTKLRAAFGTVDSGYRGEVGVLVNHTEKPISLNMQAHVIERGTRIAQGVIAAVITANFYEVDELSESERGNLGFESTGIK
ncbi:dUTP diphosphatase [Bacillus toyonensis]|uniref:dUTP diphosphatase n=1 Tax=Bacillus TaxID=1386 RepID=UPI0007786637|nr:dUTP diphosphatase [Bacillus toyonensis]KXY45507.1 deoxyuridine 5'-triphosphate nucleotidohydrolase [Bacillus cereus]PEE27585.1 dUTP diphosphatase [Bacillus toyonensis]PGC46064.1 dUTP diphosphatase [Bacillus toyonensis]PHB92067.1 dUTP diphosphatase [Bacillus toyonensis]PHE22713.1 dUTP diphosphatase [Bacillus toyonensis]